MGPFFWSQGVLASRLQVSDRDIRVRYAVDEIEQRFRTDHAPHWSQLSFKTVYSCVRNFVELFALHLCKLRPDKPQNKFNVSMILFIQTLALYKSFTYLLTYLHFRL